MKATRHRVGGNRVRREPDRAPRGIVTWTWEENGKRFESKTRPTLRPTPGAIDNRYLLVFRSSRKTAPARNIPFELTPAEFEALVCRSQGMCELSGIPFRFESEHKRNPFCPSIDRIDCAKGYTAENTRLICAALNIAMNVWGLDVILEIADAVKARRNDSKLELFRLSDGIG